MGDLCTVLLVILGDLHWLGVAVFLVFFREEFHVLKPGTLCLSCFSESCMHAGVRWVPLLSHIGACFSVCNHQDTI
jgi:hypothetical protein